MKRDYRILIVDDEVNILDVLKKSLELSGYDVDVASDPKEAINIFRTEKYHIVISDILMDGMDGIELLKEIKKIDALTQVIIITGNSTMEKTVLCLEAGASDYILKPFKSIDHVEKVIDYSIEKLERWKEVIRETASKR